LDADGERNHPLTNDALAFLTERHLAMLTTMRSDNSPACRRGRIHFRPQDAM
jgi:hypothetical protein